MRRPESRSRPSPRRRCAPRGHRDDSRITVTTRTTAGTPDSCDPSMTAPTSHTHAVPLLFKSRTLRELFHGTPAARYYCEIILRSADEVAPIGYDLRRLAGDPADESLTTAPSAVPSPPLDAGRRPDRAHIALGVTAQ
jgi:hypothetical protein